MLEDRTADLHPPVKKGSSATICFPNKVYVQDFYIKNQFLLWELGGLI